MYRPRHKLNEDTSTRARALPITVILWHSVDVDVKDQPARPTARMEYGDGVRFTLSALPG